MTTKQNLARFSKRAKKVNKKFMIMDPSELRMNLTSLRRIDPYIQGILMSSPQVSVELEFESLCDVIWNSAQKIPKMAANGWKLWFDFRLHCTNTWIQNGCKRIFKERYLFTNENASPVTVSWSWTDCRQTTWSNPSPKTLSSRTKHLSCSTRQKRFLASGFTKQPTVRSCIRSSVKWWTRPIRTS